MRHNSLRIRLISAILPFIFLVGCAGGLRPVSQGSAEARAVPTLCPERPPINDVGLTDAQRNQLYQSALVRDGCATEHGSPTSTHRLSRIGRWATLARRFGAHPRRAILFRRRRPTRPSL